MSRSIVVIGGGASGLVAAISAARQGAKVTILEQNSKLGKKVLSTGNGKCNMTNMNQDLSFYRSDVPEFVEYVLSAFSVNDTLTFFEVPVSADPRFLICDYTFAPMCKCRYRFGV